MNLTEIILKNGLMILPIFIVLVLVILIVVEKFIVIKKSKVNVGSFTIKIRGLLKRKEINEAINYCTEERSAVANILKRGLRKYKFGRKRIVEAFETASKLEILKLEKNLSPLATLSKLAPLIGFLGTIVSLTFGYFKLQEAQAAIDLTNFNNEIIGAAASSIMGIIVGIIALVSYNVLVSAIKKIVFEMEMVATEVIDVLDDSVAYFADTDITDEEVEK
ncbi:MAG: MotA/TolQ/ExbB proton channel [Ignavibacteria bacterium]|nr:MAG: MotA/TolQ/ExbB proton channel [Ignavibacteria bacterium]KAF0157278.1 MAG: MotA/TolQ/ExbB proton channel [Ignavibacteria bacterium]